MGACCWLFNCHPPSNHHNFNTYSNGDNNSKWESREEKTGLNHQTKSKTGNMYRLLDWPGNEVTHLPVDFQGFPTKSAAVPLVNLPMALPWPLRPSRVNTSWQRSSESSSRKGPPEEPADLGRTRTLLLTPRWMTSEGFGIASGPWESEKGWRYIPLRSIIFLLELCTHQSHGKFSCSLLAMFFLSLVKLNHRACSFETQSQKELFDVVCLCQEYML